MHFSLFSLLLRTTANKMQFRVKGCVFEYATTDYWVIYTRIPFLKFTIVCSHTNNTHVTFCVVRSVFFSVWKCIAATRFRFGSRSDHFHLPAVVPRFDKKKNFIKISRIRCELTDCENTSRPAFKVRFFFEF